MNDKLAIYGQFEQIKSAAVALQESGYFKDVTSKAQAIVKVMAGAELGLPPFASMSGIFIIQGKPVLGANVLATLVKNDPRYNYQVKQCSNAICELTWFEDGKQVGTSSFTIEEAKAAGLTDKDNWRKYPSDMLFARAISRGARRFAPGIFGGSPVYTPDEMDVDMNEEGVIDGVAKDVTPAPIQPDQPVQDAKDAIRNTQTQAEEVIERTKPTNGDMKLEEAKAITNEKNIPYGDLPVAQLLAMYNTIDKNLRDGKYTSENQDIFIRKLKAIKLILADHQS